MLVPMHVGQLPAEHLAQERCTVNAVPCLPSSVISQSKKKSQAMLVPVDIPAHVNPGGGHQNPKGVALSLFFRQALLVWGEGQIREGETAGGWLPEDVLSPSIRSPKTRSTEPTAGLQCVNLPRSHQTPELGRLTSFYCRRNRGPKRLRQLQKVHGAVRT